MKLVLNDIDTVERRELNGREHLVAPVTAMRAMNLHRGYVPEAEIAKSVSAWNGTPITLNHPHDADGNIVSANSPEVAEKTWLGHFFNATKEDDTLQGEIWLDIQNAKDIGGDATQILNKLEADNEVSVSTSYFGDRLEPGTYDGEYRDTVRGNIRPDHLAILPNKSGRCSVEDGCMAGAPAANAVPDDVDTVPPEAAQQNAQMALDARDDTGNPNDCGRQTGWTRANQLASGESLSEDVIGRMASFARHEDNKEQGDEGRENCGWMMWKAWGGDEGVEWAQRKIDEIDSAQSENIMVCATDDPDEFNEDPMGEETPMDTPTVNKTIDGIRFTDTEDGSLDESSISEEEFDDHYVFDENTKSASSFPLVDADGNLRAGNVASAFRFRSDASDESRLLSVLQEANREFDDPPIEPESLEDAMSGNSDDGFIGNVRSFLGLDVQTSNESAESDTESTMSDKTQELVDDHGFDEENLPSEETDCFDQIYNRFVESDEGSSNDGSDEPDANEELLDEIEGLRDEVLELKEQQAKNEEEHREGLVEEVSSNTDRDEQELDELDTNALEVLADELDDEQTPANFAGTRGASANASSTEDMPALSASERAKELE